ncbi:MAG: inactive serine/threonine-protein kinase VRK3 [Polyangia bacterium]
MLPPCAQCGAVLLEGARFCGSCGVAIPEQPEPAEDAAAIARYRSVLDRFLHDGPLESHELEQLEALRQRLALSLRTHERLYTELTSARLGTGAGGERCALRLFLDTETVRHFVAGARCVLRLKLVNDGPLLLEIVAVHTEVLGGERLLPARGEPVFPGKSGLLTVWLVPQLPGFCEVRGVVHVVDLLGTASAFRFDGVQFRVGAPGEPAPVSVVNIDQRSARVVDNSRTQFAAPPPDRGGLVGEGDFKPVPLRPLPLAEAAALWPELGAPPSLATAPPQSDARADARSDDDTGGARGPTLRRGAPVRFTVKGEAAMYEASSVLTQGDLATLYEGRRSRDGARVVIKIADDSADNDLMQAEVSALRILRSEPSPQLKHLPVVLDQLQTRDGRLGTVLEFLDGLDLVQVRERRPHGLPAQHLIWIMRRCLSVLGWAHARGVLHGNLDPAHILVRAKDHNVWVLDWCYAIVNPARTGQGFRVLNEEYSPPEVAARKPPLPSSDLFSLGRCMIYLLGGDPQKGELPRDAETGLELDERLQRFLKFFVLDSALGRAQDAWEAYRFLDRLRQQIWGPHRFIELSL